MIKNISLPELHAGSQLAESHDDQFDVKNKDYWSNRKAFNSNKMFDIVSKR